MSAADDLSVTPCLLKGCESKQILVGSTADEIGLDETTDGMSLQLLMECHMCKR